MGVEEAGEGDAEDRFDLGVGEAEHGRLRHGADEGVDAEVGRGDVERGEGAEDVHALGRQADLLVRLAQRRLPKRLALFPTSAGEGDLAGVLFEGAVPHREDERRSALDVRLGEEQRQHARLAARLPLDGGERGVLPVRGRHRELGGEAGERRGQAGPEAVDERGERGHADGL